MQLPVIEIAIVTVIEICIIEQSLPISIFEIFIIDPLSQVTVEFQSLFKSKLCTVDDIEHPL